VYRPPPWDQEYVESDAHPITGLRSADRRADRRQERIAMNRLRHQMMNWGHSWIATAGGDVQHQVAHVAFHYIYLLDYGRDHPIHFEDYDKVISEYR
jgi:hypothetical protein